MGFGGEVFAEEEGERLGQVAADGAVVVDEQLLEERLVEQPADLGLGEAVRGLAVLGELEGVVQVVLDVGEDLFGGGQAALSGLHLGRDAILFALEQVEGDGIGVVGLKELGALVVEGGEAGLLLAAVQLGVGAAGAESVLDVGAEGLGALGGEADAGVVVGDLGLDPLDRHGLLGAAGAVLVAAEADEVGVDGAVAVLGVGDREAGATLAAEHGALEVMGVGPLAFACGVLGGEHGLDSVPDVDGDQRWVGAGVAGAAVADQALVVGVAEQPVELRLGERLAGPLRSRNGGEAAARDGGDEPADGPVAGGVRVERPGDDRRSLGVDRDRADLAAVLGPADVDVPDRGLAGGAAPLGLLCGALDDLGGEVAGVELGDRAHDAVQQQPAGRLVDVLGDRDEGRTGFLQREVDRHVVGPVAGEPVDLVHDHVGHRVLVDEGEQTEKFLAVGGLGGLALLDELGDDLCAEAVGLAVSGIALAGDGEAFGLAAHRGLFLGTDPQVEDGDGLARFNGGNKGVDVYPYTGLVGVEPTLGQ